jgi:hypothetical protein
MRESLLLLASSGGGVGVCGFVYGLLRDVQAHTALF